MNIEADARPRKRAWNHRAVSLVAPCVLLLVLMLMEPDVPLVIFAGILLAVLISASGRWIGRCVGKPRGIGIGLFLLMTIVGLAGLFTAFVPAILEQTNAFVEQTPAAIEALRERVAGLLWPDRMLAGVSPFSLFSGESAAMAAGAVRATFAGLGNFVIVLLVGLFGGLGVDVYRRGPLSARGPDWRGQAVLLVVAMFVVVRSLESYALTPLLQQRTVSLPPALVIAAQLLMGMLFGLMELLLATPFAAVTMTLINAVYLDN